MKTDGFGNKLEVMTYENLVNWVAQKTMWCSGDTIQVKNKSGCVISTTIIKDETLTKSA
jgi:hypothetical protein